MADTLKNRYIDTKYLLHELGTAKVKPDVLDIVLDCPKIDAVPIAWLKELRTEWKMRGYQHMADTLDAMMWKYLDDYDLDGDLWNV